MGLFKKGERVAFTLSAFKQYQKWYGIKLNSAKVLEVSVFGNYGRVYRVDVLPENLHIPEYYLEKFVIDVDI